MYTKALVTVRTLKALEEELPIPEDDEIFVWRDRWEVLTRYISYGGKKSIDKILKQITRESYKALDRVAKERQQGIY